jgi:hypothetical protein
VYGSGKSIGQSILWRKFTAVMESDAGVSIKPAMLGRNSLRLN